jgi:hypothetical protein
LSYLAERADCRINRFCFGVVKIFGTDVAPMNNGAPYRVHMLESLLHLGAALAVSL